ncbi:MAG: hypothetical protein WCO84_01935 [bacterium]
MKNKLNKLSFLIITTLLFLQCPSSVHAGLWSNAVDTVNDLFSTSKADEKEIIFDSNSRNASLLKPATLIIDENIPQSEFVDMVKIEIGSLNIIDAFLQNPTVENLKTLCFSAKNVSGWGTKQVLSGDRTSLVSVKNTLYEDFGWCENLIGKYVDSWAWTIYNSDDFLFPLTNQSDSDSVRIQKINYNQKIKSLKLSEGDIVYYGKPFGRPEIVSPKENLEYWFNSFDPPSMMSSFIRTIKSPIPQLKSLSAQRSGGLKTKTTNPLTSSMQITPPQIESPQIQPLQVQPIQPTQKKNDVAAQISVLMNQIQDLQNRIDKQNEINNKASTETPKVEKKTETPEMPIQKIETQLKVSPKEIIKDTLKLNPLISVGVTSTDEFATSTNRPSKSVVNKNIWWFRLRSWFGI